MAVRILERCRHCQGPLTFTGIKMNPQTGNHKYDHRRANDHRRAAGEEVPVYDREESDEIVECENCGWTWWVHRALSAESPLGENE